MNLVSSRPGRSRQEETYNYFPNHIDCETELRQSRASLAAASERMSRASYAGSFHGGPQSIASSTRRARPRSRSRDQLNSSHLHSNRPGSRWWIFIPKTSTDVFMFICYFHRFSTAGSTHNLSNCYDTSDNWTDNDMEIYMTRNATARTGLVPLWDRIYVSWFFINILEIDVLWYTKMHDGQ